MTSPRQVRFHLHPHPGNSSYYVWTCNWEGSYPLRCSPGHGRTSPEAALACHERYQRQSSKEAA